MGPGLWYITRFSSAGYVFTKNSINLTKKMLALTFMEGPRTPLVISGSVDEGNTWKRLLTLEDKPPPAGFTGIVAKDTVSLGCSRFRT